MIRMDLRHSGSTSQTPESSAAVIFRVLGPDGTPALPGGPWAGAPGRRPRPGVRDRPEHAERDLRRYPRRRRPAQHQRWRNLARDQLGPRAASMSTASRSARTACSSRGPMAACSRVPTVAEAGSRRATARLGPTSAHWSVMPSPADSTLAPTSAASSRVGQCWLLAGDDQRPRQHQNPGAGGRCTDREYGLHRHRRRRRLPQH